MADVAESQTLGQLGSAVRDDIIDAHAQAWARIAAPGTWLTGEQRCAVALETRLARECDLCQQQKDALSPLAVKGKHAHSGKLSDAHAEAIHRLATDPGRLTKDWLNGLIADGLDDGAYIESASIVSIVSAMDAFCWAMNVPPQPIPIPIAGEPSRYRPPGAKINDGWVANIAPGDEVESDGAVYGARTAGVHRALTLVPESKRAAFDLLMVHYLSPNALAEKKIKDLDRAISRPQMEIIASRVSVLNQCLF